MALPTPRVADDDDDDAEGDGEDDDDGEYGQQRTSACVVIRLSSWGG